MTFDQLQYLLKGLSHWHVFEAKDMITVAAYDEVLLRMEAYLREQRALVDEQLRPVSSGVWVEMFSDPEMRTATSLWTSCVACRGMLNRTHVVHGRIVRCDRCGAWMRMNECCADPRRPASLEELLAYYDSTADEARMEVLAHAKVEP